nr:hypothetical protein CFP56_22529 [Quercus suber]
MERGGQAEALREGIRRRRGAQSYILEKTENAGGDRVVSVAASNKRYGDSAEDRARGDHMVQILDGIKDTSTPVFKMTLDKARHVVASYISNSLISRTWIAPTSGSGLRTYSPFDRSWVLCSLFTTALFPKRPRVGHSHLDTFTKHHTSIQPASYIPVVCTMAPKGFRRQEFVNVNLSSSHQGDSDSSYERLSSAEFSKCGSCFALVSIKCDLIR